VSVFIFPVKAKTFKHRLLIVGQLVLPIFSGGLDNGYYDALLPIEQKGKQILLTKFVRFVRNVSSKWENSFLFCLYEYSCLS
jgi:hypothetical protein